MIIRIDEIKLSVLCIHSVSGHALDGILAMIIQQNRVTIFEMCSYLYFFLSTNYNQGACLSQDQDGKFQFVRILSEHTL